MNFRFGHRKLSAIFVCLLLTLLLSTSVVASNEVEEEPFSRNTSVNLELRSIAGGFNSPIGITNAGDRRLFVIERHGTIRIIRPDGSIHPKLFLDITDRVDSSWIEEGLLGLAFHPKFEANGYFYVNYTFTESGIRRNRISRFSLSSDPNLADPETEEVLLTIEQPRFNHNAGRIMFGPDGYLYIPLGDGGGSGDPDDLAQNMSTILGKLNRIDVDKKSGVDPDCVGLGTGNYSIPADNPYIDGPGDSCDEIWSVGLRNPWQSSFDSETGALYIADVGQNNWEEINYIEPNSNGGKNFGWRCYEGNHEFNVTGCDNIAKYTFPIFEYSHGSSNCSVTGGFVYRGPAYPLLNGRYIFTDYCSGIFWDLYQLNNGSWSVTEHDYLGGFGYSAFGESCDGELFVTNIDNGTVYQVQEGTAAGAVHRSDNPATYEHLNGKSGFLETQFYIPLIINSRC